MPLFLTDRRARILAQTRKPIPSPQCGLRMLDGNQTFDFGHYLSPYNLHSRVATLPQNSRRKARLLYIQAHQFRQYRQRGRTRIRQLRAALEPQVGDERARGGQGCQMRVRHVAIARQRQNGQTRHMPDALQHMDRLRPDDILQAQRLQLRASGQLCAEIHRGGHGTVGVMTGTALFNAQDDQFGQIRHKTRQVQVLRAKDTQGQRGQVHQCAQRLPAAVYARFVQNDDIAQQQRLQAGKVAKQGNVTRQ